MRQRKPEGEKATPLTTYLRPAIVEQLKDRAANERRTVSATAALMLEHALGCHIYKQGRVPTGQIKSLRHQGK